MINFIGAKFNRLTILGMSTNGSNYAKRVICICDCGNNTTVNLANLKNSNTKSCGCLWSETIIKTNTFHGMSSTREYSCWEHIKTRCYNTKAECYPDYGGRGIKVCDRWLNSFENFFKDMGNCPSKKHSVERVENDGDYEPNNCKWATGFEQAGNKRSNFRIYYNGEYKILAEWSRILKISPSTIRKYIKKGNSFEFIYNKFKVNIKQVASELPH